MKVRNTGRHDEKIELQMTPMIDIVFQLLIFFIMTFKIVSQEGDFNIRMPLAAPREGLPDEDQLPPMKLRLTADAGGDLASMRLNERSFSSWKELNSHIISLVGDDAGLRESAEVEMDADSTLRYENVVEAVTAVSGYVDDRGDIIKLIEKIKFSPPKATGG